MRPGHIVGPRLWEFAAARGFSPERLAESTGIRINTLYQYGSAERPRPLGEQNAKKIADALGVPAGELLASTLAEPPRLMDQIEDLVKQLEDAELPHEDQEEIERQLRKLAAGLVQVAEAVAAQRLAQDEGP